MSSSHTFSTIITSARTCHAISYYTNLVSSVGTKVSTRSLLLARTPSTHESTENWQVARAPTPPMAMAGPCARSLRPIIPPSFPSNLLLPVTPIHESSSSSEKGTKTNPSSLTMTITTAKHRQGRHPPCLPPTFRGVAHLCATGRKLR
jgi:hypothetical protein